MTNNNNNINLKPCVYGCGIQIYWNTSENAYWEVFTKKHICPNRSVTTTNRTTVTKPNYYKFIKQPNILNSHKSIRWVGITDQNGIIINEEYREGIKPFLTKEEMHESAINSIIRQGTRIKFEPKIGKLTYAFGRYENLSRFIIPINENYYLLVHMDFEENNFDKIIMEKIMLLVKEIKEKK